MRLNVAEVVAGRGKHVELGGFRAEWCRAVAERVKTMAIGSCAAIAGKGCYNSVFALRVTDGDFYVSAQLNFEVESCLASEGGEWQTRVPAKERWLMGC